MIQRVQTIYLLLGAVLLGAVFFFGPVWHGVAAEAQAWFTPGVLVTGGLAAVVALVAVFLFKNRSQQRKVIVLAQVLTVLHMVALYAGLYLAGALYVRTSEGMDWAMFSMLVLPLLAYLLFLLARRAVDKDIALIKSMDRLR